MNYNEMSLIGLIECFFELHPEITNKEFIKNLMMLIDPKELRPYLVEQMTSDVNVKDEGHLVAPDDVMSRQDWSIPYGTKFIIDTHECDDDDLLENYQGETLTVIKCNDAEGYVKVEEGNFSKYKIAIKDVIKTNK